MEHDGVLVVGVGYLHQMRVLLVGHLALELLDLVLEVCLLSLTILWLLQDFCHELAWRWSLLPKQGADGRWPDSGSDSVPGLLVVPRRTRRIQSVLLFLDRPDLFLLFLPQCVSPSLPLALSIFLAVDHEPEATRSGLALLVFLFLR